MGPVDLIFGLRDLAKPLVRAATWKSYKKPYEQLMSGYGRVYITNIKYQK